MVISVNDLGHLSNSTRLRPPHYAVTMPKSKTFRHVVLCHTNDFPSNKNDKIKGWVESHGGIFSKMLTPDVTHFVASKPAWKKYPPVGRLAALPFRDKMVKVSTSEKQPLTLPSSSSSPAEEHEGRQS